MHSLRMSEVLKPSHKFLSPQATFQTLLSFFLFCQGTFIFNVVKYKPLMFNKTYIYPTWAYALGWSLGLFCVLLVPLWIVYKANQMKGTALQVCMCRQWWRKTHLMMVKHFTFVSVSPFVRTEHTKAWNNVLSKHCNNLRKKNNQKHSIRRWDNVKYCSCVFCTFRIQ